MQVLLPTYDGARYLPALLDSIAAQDHRPLRLLVRDDGSRDRSVEVVQRFAEQSDLGVEVHRGDERLGPYRSFLRLLQCADPSADFFAFADQDDVWRHDKVSRAVRALRHEPRAGCYGAAVTVTDHDLRPLTVTRAPKSGPSFRHALFETLDPASTLVLSAAFRELLVQHLPEKEVYPDLWCYQVATAVDRYEHDPQPALLYRQHGDNAIGVSVGAWGRWVRRLRRAAADGAGLGPRHWQQLEELRERFATSLPSQPRAELDALLATRRSWAASVAYAVRGPVVRRTRLDAVAVRATLLLPTRSR